jgi:uncharacterized protein (TIGR00725 family)
MEYIMNFYIGVIGSREYNKITAETAYKTGRLIAQEKWILICGGMGGIMEYSSKGAYENNGISVGILPENTRKNCSRYLSYSIVTGLGEARNSIVVKSCNALISISGSFGTLSEISFAKLYGIPVVSINSWQNAVQDGKIIELADYSAKTPEDAVNIIKELLHK